MEQQIAWRFKQLLTERLPVHQIVLFGSRARGDADAESDMDILVVLDGEPGKVEERIVSDSAWEAGIDHGMLVVPITFGRR